MSMIRAMIVLSCALVVAGCATIPRDAGLADVERELAERGRLTLDREERIEELLAGELDADRAVALALANSPRVRVILSGLGMAAADLAESRTISNPVFEAEIRFPADPFRPYEFSLAQSLLDLVQLPQRRRLGATAFEAAKLRVAAEMLSFAATVRDRYYEVVAAAQNLAISRTVAEAARVGAELAQRQHVAGNITDLDLESEQTLYEDAKLDLARTEEQLILRRESLIRLLGLREPNLTFTIAAEFPQPPEREPTDKELAATRAERRLDLLIAQRDLDVARRAVPLARASAIGEVVADVHLEREGGGAKTAGPGIELPIPIFNTGRAARMRAESRLVEAEEAFRALSIEAESEIRTARERVVAARARVDYYRDVVLPRRKRIVELTKLEHNAMLLGTYALLDARRREIVARRDYVEAQRQYWSARNDLDRSLNGIESAFAMSVERAQRPEPGARRGGH
ncbi:MAG TPA: TolC family protein [Thermoanaerobaculia bacterium]|nr:TolC family protein [Thermoanaerobaculia bacterium]